MKSIAFPTEDNLSGVLAKADIKAAGKEAKKENYCESRPPA